MSFNKALSHLKKFNLDDRVKVFDVSSATVELAAEAVGVEPARIAKTLSFDAPYGCILIVTAGDMKVNGAKFKAEFGVKPRMLTLDSVEENTGHQAGGVCPFGAKDGVSVYLDVSMQRFDTVYPACGSANSSVRLSCEELYESSGAKKWVDVCVSIIS
ncbi:MAG: YbaK/EbsC family protein [Synergistaceae bacterium]|nr:YbaK/EbsC family protein [Synergistaceae bacterium]